MSEDSTTASQAQQASVVFARAPGQTNSTEVLDYSKDAANKLYKNATAPLVSLHDLSAGNLRDFLQLLVQRVDQYAWETILKIKIEDGSFVNLLTQYVWDERNILDDKRACDGVKSGKRRGV